MFVKLASSKGFFKSLEGKYFHVKSVLHSWAIGNIVSIPFKDALNAPINL